MLALSVENQRPNAVVFFDGVCILCNTAVDFLIGIDKKHKLFFSPLQGKTYSSLRSQQPQLPAEIDTIILWVNDKAYVKSKAILKSLEYIGGIWSLAKIFQVIPSSISDWAYDF